MKSGDKRSDSFVSSFGEADGEPRVRVFRNDTKAALPSYATEGAAGADVEACVGADITLLPGERKKIPTGLVLEIPPGWEAQVRPRSGLAVKHGVTVLNAPGTIDSDYRGEVEIILINCGTEPYTVHSGDRIAQLVFAPAPQLCFEAAEELGGTQRGGGGFGSTGMSKR